MSAANTRTISVDYLARVEGEGALNVKIRDDRVTSVQLKIFEPPRFFEAFLRGRDFREAADITARICGICPVAYQMSAVHAMEQACGVAVTGPLRELRRLLYCGEWIESHALHVYMLHAPDFLGYPDAIRMAADHPEAVRRGLELKKVGNEIVQQIGGREIHPVNVRVGGLYRTPAKKELAPLLEKLKRALDLSLQTVQWVAGFNFPEFNQDYLFVALHHPQEYPFNEGRLISNRGLDIEVTDYEKCFEEEHMEHSNALHSVMKEDRNSYFVGPLARVVLNYNQLSPAAREAAAAAGFDSSCRNPFRSIIARSVELVYACDEAIRIIESYEEPGQPCVAVEPRQARGCGCTEAPRGILYHRYDIDDGGIIHQAKIVPPTSQNQRTIEQDLRSFVTERIQMPQEELTHLCEQAVRNYDPCISCATHFLKLQVEREE